MDQKKRDKIAWILAIALTPVFVYLLAVNVFGVGRQAPAPSPVTPGPEPAPAAPPAPAVLRPPAPVARPATRRPQERRPDAETLAEQREIAARLPVRNPFMPKPPEKDEEQVEPAAEFTYRVGAIVLSPGSRRRMAMIDGALYEEGDRIGRWTILRVNPHEVIFCDGSRRRTVGVK